MMNQDTGATVALRGIKKVPDASELFGENYEVTFDIRFGDIEGTIAVPVSMQAGADTETVLRARHALHRAFAELADEAVNVPAARNQPRGVDATECGGGDHGAGSGTVALGSTSSHEQEN